MEEFVRGLPKAELHLHIEGTLEPELMFELAERNQLEIPYGSVDEVRAAYEFDDLQAFLDIYYQAAEVLRTEDDFADLMAAYLLRAVADGVRHAEIFFDPQTHTERGVDVGTVIRGFARAQQAAAAEISTTLILCFLRHLPSRSAVKVLEASLPYLDHLQGVGLDSGEAGNPPELFAEPYRLAVEAGLRPVAHAGEEGPAGYIRAALDVLGVERVDHGVRASDDPGLVRRLATERIPLTMCPLSNQKLKVVPDLADHNLKELMDAGVMVTVNSDDPAYFGGYVADNYLAIAEALDLSRDDLVRLALNSVEASFLPDDRKAALRQEISEYLVIGDW
ncbi:MAG: adenosine deaminase [bacterium]|nr:adenosine deaminase [bacterium]MDE0290864.1 adenosine deaminase [bacterium]MDE0439220.1 adenosine deaminase [bacterium]